MSLLVKCCDSKSQGCGRVQQDPASDELSPALGKHSCPLPAPRFSTTSPSCPLSRGSETILSSSSLWFAVWREINQKDHKGRRGRVTGGLMGRAIITTQGPSISPFPGRGHRGPAGTRCHSQVCPYKAGAAPLTQDTPLALAANTGWVPGAGGERWTETERMLGPAQHPRPRPAPNFHPPSHSLQPFAPGRSPGLGGPVSHSRVLGQGQESPARPVSFSATDNSITR